MSAKKRTNMVIAVIAQIIAIAVGGLAVMILAGLLP